MHKVILVIVLVALAGVPVVSGAPTTLPVTNITGGQADFHASGNGSDGWFEWGAISGGYYHWVTPNQTYTAEFGDTQLGTPLLTGQTYYVRACDDTGCGNEVSWTSSPAILHNKTNYGGGTIQMIRSGFSVDTVLGSIAAPYTNVVPGGAAATWGMLFFFIFAGYWLRPKDILIPCMLAMLSGGAIWLGGSSLGVPPVFASIGQGLMYAAIAGVAVSWFSK